MLLPILIYGHPTLRKVSEDIPTDYPDLDKFLKDMWQTMEESDGVGLAAPQVGKNVRIFVANADALPISTRIARDSGRLSSMPVSWNVREKK